MEFAGIRRLGNPAHRSDFKEGRVAAVAEKLWQVRKGQQDGVKSCTKRFSIKRHKLSLSLRAPLVKPMARLLPGNKSLAWRILGGSRSV
jgi:hypothetical protein